MNYVCILCNTSTDDPLHYGVLKRTRGVTAHYFCVLMSTSITQSGKDHEGILGFLERDIRIVAKNCKMIRCIYCLELGATIACFHENCKKNFHFPCGLKNKCSFKFCEKYETFCNIHNHYPKLNITIKKNMKNIHCIACLEVFEDEVETNVLATACCKLHLIHVECAKQMALNAGYFTKCPVCNNIDQFSDGLRNSGIYIPLQDASWEQPRGAYSELTHVQRSCDLTDCKCPHGKEFNNKTGLWKFILCTDCGSFAAHKGCVKFHTYLCDTCSTVEITLRPGRKRCKRDESETEDILIQH